MTELFDTPENLSPKLAWMRKHWVAWKGEHKLIDHLAIEVMGWVNTGFIGDRFTAWDSRYEIEIIEWNPLENWADCGMLIEAALDNRGDHRFALSLGLGMCVLGDKNQDKPIQQLEFLRHGFCRSICLVIAKATGWTE